MHRRWLHAALVAVVMSASIAACAGAGGPDIDELIKTADVLLVDLDAAVDVAPRVTESKAIEYVSATALVVAAEDTVGAELAGVLGDTGWTIRSSEALDVSGTPAGWGYQIVAERQGEIARLVLYDRIGSRESPAGELWLQLSVAWPNDALAWTQP